MARRSARLQKRSTPPAETPRKSDDSWQTASSPDLKLPSLPELPDPSTAIPQQNAVAAPQPASKLPQATAMPTPAKAKSAKSQLAVAVSRTPTNRTPIKPAGTEMHPAHHHASTAKVLDEARWLGFQALGAHTAPPKALGIGQSTPSKTPVAVAAHKSGRVESSPDFRFRFKSPFESTLKGPQQDAATLSPSTRKLLDEPKSNDIFSETRPLFNVTEFQTKADVSPQRKKVEPKGRLGRFSDAHKTQFQKMDSIANHASAFRADPGRFKPVQGLKKSASKPDLVQPASSTLKRTQSKADITESNSKPAGALKRTQSKMDLAESSKIPPSPLKRTQSKIDLTGSSLPRSQSTVRLVPATRDDSSAIREGDKNPVAKRVKRSETDDAATTRPVSRDGKLETAKSAVSTPARKTALPRLTSRLMTPTKSSVARTQSVKTTKPTSMIPSMLKSPSTSNMFSPTNISQTMRDGARESMRKATQSLQRVRSILRTPSRKFSEDPAKIAAGTHMSPPSTWNFNKALPPLPATAPAAKHVNFTTSTLERAGETEFGKSPSPVKLRAGSEVPAGAVIYPSLQSGNNYPTLPQLDEMSEASPSRRLTFGGETVHEQRQFSFDSGTAIKFGPATTGTIRMVRKSDASTLVGSKKRKLEVVQETSDKENDKPTESEYRSAKKIKATPMEPKTPVSTSKLPRRTPGRSSGISKSRLAFLATPKRSKA